MYRGLTRFPATHLSFATHMHFALPNDSVGLEVSQPDEVPVAG